jgi:hypothetical protein
LGLAQPADSARDSRERMEHMVLVRDAEMLNLIFCTMGFGRFVRLTRFFPSFFVMHA